MQLRSLVRAATAAALLGLVAPTVARAQTIVKDNSSPVVVNAISEYQTDFNTVGGMFVSWTLTGGGGSASWADISAASGIAGAWGVWTDDFKLWGNGSTDTYNDNVWNLWAMDLTSFSMNALLGNAVFDTRDPNPGTEKSAQGKNFNWDGNGPDSRVTYYNPIALGSPDNFEGDLYGMLTVEFGAYACTGSGWSDYGDTQCKKFDHYVCSSGVLGTGSHADDCWDGHDWDLHATKVYTYKDATWIADIFGTDDLCVNNQTPGYKESRTWEYQKDQNGNYVRDRYGNKIKIYSGTDIDNTECGEKFSQDMDNLDLGGGTPQDVIPEPATMTLLATGLAGMAAARRRRNRK